MRPPHPPALLGDKHDQPTLRISLEYLQETFFPSWRTERKLRDDDTPWDSDFVDNGRAVMLHKQVTMGLTEHQFADTLPRRYLLGKAFPLHNTWFVGLCD